MEPENTRLWRYRCWSLLSWMDNHSELSKELRQQMPEVDEWFDAGNDKEDSQEKDDA